MQKKYIFAVMMIGMMSVGISCSHSASKKIPVFDDTTIVANKPLFKDFMGLNGHVTFKPGLYGQVCRLVRMYHNIDWDAKAPGDALNIPHTLNHINWKDDVYGPWKQDGFETDICLQFLSLGVGNPQYKTLWAGKEQWGYDYARAMAAYFGPSGKEKLCTSFEIDNEPGNRFDRTLFSTLFKKMAQGIRDADSQAKIVTPAVVAGKGDDYSQGLDDRYQDTSVLPLYDVINLHTYPTMEKSATNENSWNRSYPEDKSLQYLKVIDDAIAWRNQHAPQKEVWITEFGYDACTPEAMKLRKDWALKLNWQGATDLQQAQYLVRSFMAFAARDVQRAYLYYYNDEDEASFHASSGLTRHFVPKMSFWAVKQLYATLGTYRFRRIVKQQEGQLYVYEFERGDNPSARIWVAWSPTGTPTNKKEGYQPKSISVTLDNLPGLPVSVTGMATTDGVAPAASFTSAGPAAITLTIGESPVYISMPGK
ncbi:hypothetical protein [Chitinophaga eiseniae]|uniref:Glycosyl hydrolase catalytic core n=1 Tax=Chitinophaga eiseniae TaxID=634771 RepID=A0A847SJ68_9BACT|nr:hypothetical protein [Chitinophaga eiseniae]NLR80194.1 hypothetical protein [Chitinophaga eiseniae]